MRTKLLLLRATAVPGICALLGLSLEVMRAEMRPSHAADTHETKGWDSPAAARYLDARQTWWTNWPKSQRDHETACVSCHTALPYALARPSLRQTLGETEPSHPERVMLTHVARRVELWDELEPFYNDAKSGPRKTVESRGTESVLNALILARYDAQAGEGMRAITQKAFRSMWSMQLRTGEQAGAWEWLNFHNAPWESNESQYYGATLGAIAIGATPASYRNSAEVQEGMQALRGYITRNYAAQPLANRVVVLWASSRFPGLLTKTQRKELLTALAAAQNPDGGWSLARMGEWKRKDGTALDTKSDGYATGLTVYALEQANGSNGSKGTPEMTRAISWLIANQSARDGNWSASSLNKQREASADAAKFMSDAATSYSVLALEGTRR